MHTLGKYKLQHLPLGRGGFGTVYRAWDTALRREVAIKVLHPQLMVDPGFVERFRNEARLVAGLEHPNLIKVYELGEADGRAYLVMHYLSGGSLRQRIEKGPIPFDQALSILKQVSAGLSVAHTKGIIHRDIKPENILFAADGQAILSDFGLAKAVLGGSSSSSSSIGGVGTPSYRAPELWRGKPPASPVTDQYALACVFAEMLTGRQLFSGDTPDEIITKHLVDGAEWPKIWPPSAPKGVTQVLARALERDPAKRYPCLGEFIDSLEGLLRSKVLQTHAKVSYPVRSVSTNRSTSNSLNLPTTRTIRMLLVIAVLLGLFLVGGAILAPGIFATEGSIPTTKPPGTTMSTQILTPTETFAPTETFQPTHTSYPPTATQDFSATQSAKNTATVRDLLVTKNGWISILNEDFGSKSDAWHIGEIETIRGARSVRLDINSGEYVWSADSGAGVIDWIIAPTQSGNYKDFFVSVDGYVSQSNSVPTFALVYGNDVGLYTMGFNPYDGTFDSAYLELGTSEFKSMFYWTTSEAIKIGRANKIAVYSINDSINLFINGQLVGNFFPEKSTLPITRFGIMVGMREGDEVVYRFDNFQVWVPKENVPTSVPSPTSKPVSTSTIGDSEFRLLLTTKVKFTLPYGTEYIEIIANSLPKACSEQWCWYRWTVWQGATTWDSKNKRYVYSYDKAVYVGDWLAARSGDVISTARGTQPDVEFAVVLEVCTDEAHKNCYSASALLPRALP